MITSRYLLVARPRGPVQMFALRSRLVTYSASVGVRVGYRRCCSTHILETDPVGDAMISLFQIVDDSAIEDEKMRQDKLAIDYSLGFYRVMRRFLECPSVTVPSSVESGILQFENTDEQFADCSTSAVVFTSERLAEELRLSLFGGMEFQSIEMNPPELLSRLGVRDPTASFDSIYLNGIITVPFPNESLSEAIHSFETKRLLEYTLGDRTSTVNRNDALDALLKRTMYTIPSLTVADNKGPCLIGTDGGDTVVPLFLDKLAAATFVHRQVSPKYTYWTIHPCRI